LTPFELQTRGGDLRMSHWGCIRDKQAGPD
jgi:hypothetical protein